MKPLSLKAILVFHIHLVAKVNNQEHISITSCLDLYKSNMQCFGFLTSLGSHIQLLN